MSAGAEQHSRPAPTMPAADPELLTMVSNRLATVRGRIARACGRRGRDPRSVRLVAVTKGHPARAVRALVASGVTELGENRVGEMLSKMDIDLPVPVSWHFVGRLQSNKARDVIGRVALVHSVDRRSLAEALSRRAQRAEVVQRMLIQVNVGRDPAKAGCDPDDALELVGLVRQLPGLAVEGLTTMLPRPPADRDVRAHARPFFARLRELRDTARTRWPEVSDLSMGMSADFEVAVEEGATIVRLGTALLGPRSERP